jgi:hypothetical protein
LGVGRGVGKRGGVGVVGRGVELDPIKMVTRHG